MSIISSSFLFLFLPLSVCIYHLIPACKNLFYRNLFLVIVSLFFYAWGDPYYVFLLLFLMLFVYIAGILVNGKQKTLFAKIIVFFTVLLGIGVIIYFRDTNIFLPFIEKATPQTFSHRKEGAPLGMNFFIFFAVSYVVDIYRGKCNAPKNFLYTALYLSAFFK